MYKTNYYKGQYGSGRRRDEDIAKEKEINRFKVTHGKFIVVFDKSIHKFEILHPINNILKKDD